jgi:hypothetical protein
MAATNVPRHGNDKRSPRQHTRKDAERLKKLTGTAPRADEDIRALLLRNAIGFAVGVLGAGVTFGAFWLNKETWPEQTAMLLLLVTFAFLVLMLVALVSFAGVAGESYAVNRLKMMSLLSDAEEESTKSFVTLEIFSVVASTIKWTTWDVESQKRLISDGYELCANVAAYKSDEELTKKIQQLRSELVAHAPDNKLPRVVERKLKDVEQLVLS